jgi:hypothetical protein
MTTPKFIVTEIVRFGLLFGYAVVEVASGKTIRQYDEDEKYLADSRCELKNLLSN